MQTFLGDYFKYFILDSGVRRRC